MMLYEVHLIPLFSGINEQPLTSSTKKGAKLLIKKKKRLTTLSPLCEAPGIIDGSSIEIKAAAIWMFYTAAFEVQVAT